VEKPWLREANNFRHPELLVWVENQRARLIWAAHTIIQAWIMAGRPKYSGKPLGSYEKWSGVLGGILQFIGIEGFLSNSNALYEAVDGEGEQLSGFVQAWAKKFHADVVKVADLLPLAEQHLDKIALVKDQQARLIKLGCFLKQNMNRIVDGCKIFKVGRSGNSNQWRLVRVK
jgi:hypothetical protein